MSSSSRREAPSPLLSSAAECSVAPFRGNAGDLGLAWAAAAHSLPLALQLPDSVPGMVGPRSADGSDRFVLLSPIQGLPMLDLQGLTGLASAPSDNYSRRRRPTPPLCRLFTASATIPPFRHLIDAAGILSLPSATTTPSPPHHRFPALLLCPSPPPCSQLHSAHSPPPPSPHPTRRPSILDPQATQAAIETPVATTSWSVPLAAGWYSVSEGRVA
nr:unnamed protein product [Digitaria exilis]CAB3477235.1 unnamed protein product [Digitaria exilis]